MSHTNCMFILIDLADYYILTLLLFIILERAYGKEIIVCHNIPSCSLKITPNCKHPDQCQVASVQGHQLYGCTVLCFVYPIDRTTPSCDE